MWPLYPLVVNNLLTPTLCSATTLLGAHYAGQAPWWAPLAAILLFGLSTRFIGATDHTAGTIDRADYERRAAIVEEASKTPGPLRMFKATASNTFRIGQIKEREQKETRLDLSSFCHVIEVNTEEGWCDVEGSTTFETFVAETAKYGCMPLVVPELKTITVGGTIVGIGIESSSFKHGFVHEGMLEADILIAAGNVVTIRPDNECAMRLARHYPLAHT